MEILILFRSVRFLSIIDCTDLGIILLEKQGFDTEPLLKPSISLTYVMGTWWLNC